MQEREKKKKQRQSIIMLSAVQTDIETKAQDWASHGKALQNKNRKKKKKIFSSTYIAPQKNF